MLSHPLGAGGTTQIIAQWVWNLRLELGQEYQPTPMRLTELGPAQVVEAMPTGGSIQAVETSQVAETSQAIEAPQVIEASQAVESTQAIEAIQPVTSVQAAQSIFYGPPQWARQSYTKGFAGSDFRLLPDGTDTVSSRSSPLSEREKTGARWLFAGALRRSYWSLPHLPSAFTVSRKHNYAQAATGNTG